MPHPADIGIAFWAHDLRGAFQAAAQGLCALLGGKGLPPGDRSIRIHVEGDDREELLYNWLSEILYYFDGEDLLISRCQIQRADDRSLDAVCTGAAPTEESEETYDVKAITYHQLALDRVPEGWRGRFFVDI